MRPVGLVGFVVEHGAALVPGLTAKLVEEIWRRNPAYAAGPVSREDLHASCHDNISRVLELLTIGLVADDAPADPLYDAARATGRLRAEQRVPLDDVLRSFRLGGRLIWGELIARAGEQGSLDSSGMTEVGSRLWEVVDETSAQVAATYHLTERERLRADEQRRGALWEDLLTGSEESSVTAARALGLAAEGAYVVVVAADALVEGVDAFPVAAAHDALARGRCVSTWQHRGGTCVGVVVLPEDGGTDDPARDVAAMLRPATGLAAGVVPATSVAGLVEAHRLAGLALECARAEGLGAVTLDDRLPEALLVRSPELAERLVSTVLGQVLSRSDAERVTLLETLEAWIASAGSVTRTGELLHCHRNTVLNRLRRLRELTGRDDLREGRVPAEVDLAMRALALRS